MPHLLQRPVDHLPGLKALPVWELADLRPQNRWSSKSSMTGLGLASTHLAGLQDQVEVMAAEAAALMEEVGAPNSTWAKESLPMMLSGAAYQRGLYEWAKRRHLTCSHATKTCTAIKKFTDSSKCKKCLSKYLLVEPGSRQVGRLGPTNGRLRALLPLLVPDGDVTVTAGGQKVWLLVLLVLLILVLLLQSLPPPGCTAPG